MISRVGAEPLVAGVEGEGGVLHSQNRDLEFEVD